MNVLGAPLRRFRPTEPASELTAGREEGLAFSSPIKPLPGIKIPALGYPSSLRVGEGTRAPSRLRGLVVLESYGHGTSLAYSGLPTPISWWSGFNCSELNVNGLKKRAFGLSCPFPVKISGSRVARSSLMGWNICAGSISTRIGSHTLDGAVGISEPARKIRAKEQF